MYLDEFDAFYHTELAQQIMTILTEMEDMQIAVWMEAATILGLFVVGGLSATWLNVKTKLVYTVGEAAVNLQATLDGVLPRLLSLLTVLAVFALLRCTSFCRWNG